MYENTYQFTWLKKFFIESLKELFINFKYEELVNYLKHKKTFKYSSKDEDKNI